MKIERVLELTMIVGLVSLVVSVFCVAIYLGYDVFMSYEFNALTMFVMILVFGATLFVISLSLLAITMCRNSL